MRLLLDTHAVLWTLARVDLLSQRAADLVKDLGNDLLISAATLWEISIKHHLGKLPEGAGIVQNSDGLLTRLRAESLPMTAAHAVLAGQLDWAHRDPFDRMLAAQAIIENVPLISADTAFDGVPSVRRLW